MSSSSNTIQRRLIERSAALARTSPDSWAEFISALSEYTDDQRNNCIISPLDILPVMQGRALASTALLLMLRECVHRADKHRENK